MEEYTAQLEALYLSCIDISEFQKEHKVPEVG